MEFVFTPWKGMLIEDLRSAQREVILVCPYITKVIADEIFEVVANRGVEVRTVSRFERAEFHAGSSDLDAHYALSGTGNSRKLSGSFELRSLSKVHAKMFLIDCRIAYVGSSNLTFSGLLRNYEGTVRIVGEEKVAPLRREILDVWPRLRRVERQDFVEMLGKLQGSAQNKAARVAAEHVYDIHASIEGDEPSAAGEDFRRAVDEATAASRSRSPSESVPVPSTDEIVLDSLGIVVPQHSTELEDAAPEAQTVRPAIDIVREHARIVRRFLDMLRDRFGADVSRSPTSYARVLKTRACASLWADDMAGQIDFGPVDARSLYLEDEDRIYNVGVAAYELCVAHVSVKSGILSTFGAEMASHFRQKALADTVLLSAWRHNFLGPQLYGNAAEQGNERFALRAIRQSTFKLFATLLMYEGLNRMLEIFEEFFNPVDVLGTDAVSLVEFEAAKTTLQNLAQRHGWKLPIYPTATSEGAQDALVWQGYAQMLGYSSTGKANRQKEAENLAAAELLRLLELSPKWGQAVQEYRTEQLDKAYKQHQPLFPRVELGNEAVRSLTRTTHEVFGLSIKPSLGFVSLVDNETRRLINAPWSNVTMSWFGSFVLNLMIAIVQDHPHRMGSPELRKALFGLFRIEDLRRSVGIKAGILDAAHGGVIVNALCCALYFSNSFEAFLDKVRPVIANGIEPIPKPKVFNPFDRAAFYELLLSFNQAVLYTGYVQEVTQSRDRTLPEYVVTDVITSPPGRDDGVGLRCIWRGHSITVRAKSKVIARNMAAYALCKKLVADDSLWKEPESGLSSAG